MTPAHLLSIGLGVAAAAFALVVAWRFGRLYVFAWTWFAIAVFLILRSLSSWLVAFYGGDVLAGTVRAFDALYVPILIRALFIVGSVQLFILFAREEPS